MLIQWIIVAVFVLIGLAYIQFEHHSKKVKIFIFVIIGGLIYFSMMSVFTSETVDLTSPRGMVNGVYVYFGWIGQTATSLWDIGTDTAHMVGNAIKVDKVEEDKQPRR
jgi:hypothetical protein